MIFSKEPTSKPWNRVDGSGDLVLRARLYFNDFQCRNDGSADLQYICITTKPKWLSTSKKGLL